MAARSSFRSGDPLGTLTFGNFSRSNHGTLLIGNNQENNSNASELGSTYKVLVTNSGSVTGGLIGGGGNAGSNTISILPWATYTTKHDQGDKKLEISESVTSNPFGGFLTYDATNGFRALDRTTEYESSNDPANWGATKNARVTLTNATGVGGNAITLGADTSVNSLLFDRAEGVSNGDQKFNLGGKTLTVTSGAIAVVSGTNAEFTNGTVAFGGADIYAYARQDLNFNVPITGSGKFVIGSGSVGLNANNIGFTGDYIVQGELVISHPQSVNANNAIVLAGSSMVTTRPDDARSGNLRLQASISGKSLSGNGRVQFNNGNVDLLLGTPASDVSAQSFIAVGSGSFIAPGDAGGEYQVGRISVGNTQTGTMAFESGSQLKLDLASKEIFDTITFENNNDTPSLWKVRFDAGSTIAVNFVGLYLPVVGDSWQIFSDVTASDGAGFGTFTNGAELLGNTNVVFTNAQGYEFSLSNGGLLTLTVPEPATFGTLALGVSMLALRRRRNRTT